MNKIKELTIDEAVEDIKNGQTIACSGFTAAGSLKVIPSELAQKAEKLHAAGEAFGLTVFSGASTGDSMDGVLARANVTKRRFPYQTNTSLREAVNASSVAYADLHLSHFPQQLAYGFFGEIDWAIIEVCDFNEKGELVLTSSVGSTPTFCKMAKKIILEYNQYHPKNLRGIHDIYLPENPPSRGHIPIYSVKDRIGSEVVKVDPAKIVGFVHSNSKDEVREFKESVAAQEKIGDNVATFLANEIKNNRIPKDFLPIQSGVGNIANAALKAMGTHRKIPPFQMYSEVAQNSVIELMQTERITFTSAAALTVTSELLESIYENLAFFKNRIVLRPQEISNHPEVVRRLGLISINTGLEADIFGNVNSTHVFGNMLMNGIGGSGDFTRNAYISIFTLPSVAKDGKISSLVPFCSHIDHTEHDVQVIVTEQGVADLRGKDPSERANEIIENCAHPDYKSLLRDYLKLQKKGRIKHNLPEAFRFYLNFFEKGDMRL